MSNQGLFVFFLFFFDFFFSLFLFGHNDLFHQMNCGFRNYPHLLCRYEKKKHRIVHLVILYFSLYETNFIMNYSLFRSYYSIIGLFFYFFGFFVCVMCVCVFFHYLPSQYFAVLRFLFM